MTHSPDAAVNAGLCDLGDLVLAGHTHGGQIRLPWFGALYASSRYGRAFDRGWFLRRDGLRMLVTAGAGETGGGLFRQRLLCPPEIVVLDLSPAAEGAPTEDIS